jgi:hypothetical protein
MDALAFQCWKERLSQYSKAHEDAVAANQKADPDGSKQKQMLREMFDGSDKRNQEFASFVKEIVNLSVWPQMPWLMAGFREVPLADDEVPMIVTETEDMNDRVYATTVGQNGGVVQSQMTETLSEVILQVRKYATMKEFPILDIQQGRLDKFTLAMKQATRNLAARIDYQAKVLLQACATSSGLRAATWNRHADIKTATLPDTNVLDLSSGYGTTGVWTVPKYKEVLKYFTKIGADVEQDGRPLRVKAIFQSVLRTPDKWDFVSEVAGYAHATAVLDPKDTVPSDVRAAIFRGGEMSSLFGYDVTSVGLNTLDATEVWIIGDKPAGEFYHKAGMDEVIRDQSLDRRMQNKEAVYIAKVGLLSTLSNRKYRVLKVTL